MNKLSQIIKEEIKEKGPITFKRFMELSLYNPNLGYYSSGNANIGKEGDFYTSPSVHASFGEVISNLIVKAFEVIGTDTFSIIEFGAGKGYLAYDILNSLEKNYPNIYSKIEYKIIEISSKNIKSGEKLLVAHLNKIKWYKNISELNENPLFGIVISNEFIDAFPFHRIKKINGKINEVLVDIKNEEFFEVCVESKNTKIFDYIENFRDTLKNGQEIEVNLLARNWLKNINNLLIKGFVLTIDYGYLAGELYNSKRIRGTYKCFYKHQLSTNPYENIGKQDITYDVNFSDLIEYGEKIGLEKIRYINQGQFLIDWGIIKILENFKEHTYEKDRIAIKNLIMPELMGSKFKFLLQGKDLNKKITNEFYNEGEFKLIRKTL